MTESWNENSWQTFTFTLHSIDKLRYRKTRFLDVRIFDALLSRPCGR